MTEGKTKFYIMGKNKLIVERGMRNLLWVDFTVPSNKVIKVTLDSGKSFEFGVMETAKIAYWLADIGLGLTVIPYSSSREIPGSYETSDVVVVDADVKSFEITTSYDIPKIEGDFDGQQA